MKMNVYCVTNLLSGLSDGLFLYPTDRMASVEIAPLMVHGRHVPLDEVVLNRIGTFDTSSRALVPDDEIIPIEWDNRRLRESVMINKSPDEVVQSINSIN